MQDRRLDFVKRKKWSSFGIFFLTIWFICQVKMHKVDLDSWAERLQYLS